MFEWVDVWLKLRCGSHMFMYSKFLPQSPRAGGMHAWAYLEQSGDRVNFFETSLGVQMYRQNGLLCKINSYIATYLLTIINREDIIRDEV